jgi:hypothetical protein
VAKTTASLKSFLVILPAGSLAGRIPNQNGPVLGAGQACLSLSLSVPDPFLATPPTGGDGPTLARAHAGQQAVARPHGVAEELLLCSVASRLPDAAEVLVDMGDQGAVDHLLGGHRRRVPRPGTRS